MVQTKMCSFRPRWRNAFATTLTLIMTIGGARVYGSTSVAGNPPRGWNSYAAFSWVITEEQFLQNAQVVAEKLLPFGYEYVVVDYLWYRRLEPNASSKFGRDSLDGYGRPQPDPERWPSSRGGLGFKHVAEQVHKMGLKFGIHVMRGINLAAVNSNLPIPSAQGSPDETGRAWTTRDVAVRGGECPWMPLSFTRVDTNKVGGKAFLQSLYNQYADWGVDFVKHDCVFGSSLVLDEIATVSEAIANTGRPMVYSVSPGDEATPSMGREIAQLVNMYRVSADNWDYWGSMQPHFDIIRDFVTAGNTGIVQREGGRSWPDLDLFPFGLLTLPDDKVIVDRPSQLTADEQQAQITLWAISKSPLFSGGDLRYLDARTLDLLTNSVLLDMNARSTHNQEVLLAVSDLEFLVDVLRFWHPEALEVIGLPLQYVRQTSGDKRVWIALDPSGSWYIAFFNLGSSTQEVTASVSQIKQALLGNASGCSINTCMGQDVWSGQLQDFKTDYVGVVVATHGVWACLILLSLHEDSAGDSVAVRAGVFYHLRHMIRCRTG